jgi:hypothetical protein
MKKLLLLFIISIIGALITTFLDAKIGVNLNTGFPLARGIHIIVYLLWGGIIGLVVYYKK